MTQAIVMFSDNGNVDGMELRMSADLRPAFGDAPPYTGMKFAVSLDLQPGTIRILAGGDVVAELYGWIID